MHSVKPASRDQTTSEGEYSKGMTIKYRVQRVQRVQSTEYRVQSTESTESRESRESTESRESMARVQAKKRVYHCILTRTAAPSGLIE